MGTVRANPNEYLLVGRGGRLENRGSAVQTWLRPGTLHVLVPASKQEAAFEFTQETKDGIPLRFKGIFVYRVTDPVAAASMFDFSGDGGIDQITNMLTHVCLGELRDAVSHLTMAECIEGRKTTLSGVADAALRRTASAADDDPGGWGITIEVAQLAQVFIVDAALRQQLEAEVRNEIRLKSEQSNIRTAEETRLAEMASTGRLDEQKVAADQATLRREETLEVARLGRERRLEAERVASDRQALQLEQERLHAQLEADADRVAAEAPVRLLRIAREREILREDLELRRLQAEVQALEVERDLALPRARQELRLEILPVEQAPRIVEAAAKVLNGTNLSVYGDEGRLLGQLAPVLDVVARAVEHAGRSWMPAGRQSQ